MNYRPLSAFLYRAPLLPAQALSSASRRLLAHPWGRRAIEEASPSLARTLAAEGHEVAGSDAGRALSRYARRAAYRPTPQGLWAGVGVGMLGEALQVDTGARPEIVSGSAWGRVRVRARSYLDQPAVRERVTLRIAPSLLEGRSRYVWLCLGREQEGQQRASEEHTAAREAWLEAVVDACRGWTPWPEVRERLVRHPAARRGILRGSEPDEVLLSLIDDELLHCHLFPPLVGPPAETWLADALAAIGPLAAQPDQNEAEALPGELVFHGRVTLPADVVARAAALVPLLTRLQNALAGPPAERHGLGGYGAAWESLTALHGEGRIPLTALGCGDFGVSAQEGADNGTEATPASGAATTTSRFFTWLGAAIGATMVSGAPELALDLDTLDVLLPPCDPPATAELFLSPTTTSESEAATNNDRDDDTADDTSVGPAAGDGRGWLLGLHAPAGSSWGRFLHRLPLAAGEALAPAWQELRAAEDSAVSQEEAIDVSYAASLALGDLGHHPPFRTRCLALSSWPTPDREAVTPAGLGLVCEEGEAAHASELVSLSEEHATRTVSPRPLHRVRAHTAPPGIYRLLAGWTLQRQHAPWLMPLGPLADLPSLPRITLAGFVVSPATWRIPWPEANNTSRGHQVLGDPLGALRAGDPTLDVQSWRQADGLPRWVQVGEGDELIPVDLQAPEAARDLRGHSHVFELWPPPGDLPDRRGRRVEAVVAVVSTPNQGQREHLTRRNLRRAARADVVAPYESSYDEWSTYKLFGPLDRQDDLLSEVVRPFLQGCGPRSGAAKGERPPWFFQRYVEGPGVRHHVRLRLAGSPSTQATWEAALRRIGAPARESGVLSALERAPYVPERGRFGEAHLPVIHRLFQAQSEAALALLTLDLEAGSQEDRTLSLVRLFDAFATGWGWEIEEREALARRRREAESKAERGEQHAFAAAGAPGTGDRPDVESRAAQKERDQLFRRVRGRLRAWLGASSGEARDALTATLRRLIRDTREATRGLSRESAEALLPPLLHLFAVRVAGADRGAELTAYVLWERTLEGLRRSPVAKKPPVAKI